MISEEYTLRYEVSRLDNRIDELESYVASIALPEPAQQLADGIRQQAQTLRRRKKALPAPVREALRSLVELADRLVPVASAPESRTLVSSDLDPDEDWEPVPELAPELEGGDAGEDAQDTHARWSSSRITGAEKYGRSYVTVGVDKNVIQSTTKGYSPEFIKALREALDAPTVETRVCLRCGEVLEEDWYCTHCAMMPDDWEDQ